ncbi:MAG: lytic transglycosylase domain-containing protein, partial [Methylotenera sp.]|nr:lytic transglycosylase domain-containing protein [Methylotenera sp.]
MLNRLIFSGLRKMMGAVLIFAAPFACAELSQYELEVFNNEPPVIKDLLQQATQLERGEPSAENDWQAAKLYCVAARYGSAEGQFRLGMLYAAGRGVPVDADLATAMFVTASQQGHHAAQQMLETLKLKALNLPPCVISEIEPEKAQVAVTAVATAEIDQYVANLPANKRWLLDLVATISSWYKVDPKLVLSIISVES